MFCFYEIFPRFQRHRIGVLNHVFGDRCGAICHRSRDVSRGRGESVREERLFFSDKPLRHDRPADFLSQTCPFLFRPLSVRDTFIYANYTLFSNYGINKAWPPKAK